jgi:hypothetical protein
VIGNWIYFHAARMRYRDALLLSRACALVALCPHIKLLQGHNRRNPSSPHSKRLVLHCPRDCWMIQLRKQETSVKFCWIPGCSRDYWMIYVTKRETWVKFSLSLQRELQPHPDLPFLGAVSKTKFSFATKAKDMKWFCKSLLRYAATCLARNSCVWKATNGAPVEFQ